MDQRLTDEGDDNDTPVEDSEQFKVLRLQFDQIDPTKLQDTIYRTFNEDLQMLLQVQARSADGEQPRGDRRP